MKKENPSKVVIVPQPPATSTQDSTNQGPVVTSGPVKPTEASPAQEGEENPAAPVVEPTDDGVLKPTSKK